MFKCSHVILKKQEKTRTNKKSEWKTTKSSFVMQNKKQNRNKTRNVARKTKSFAKIFCFLFYRKIFTWALFSFYGIYFSCVKFKNCFSSARGKQHAAATAAKTTARTSGWDAAKYAALFCTLPFSLTLVHLPNERTSERTSGTFSFKYIVYEFMLYSRSDRSA